VVFSQAAHQVDVVRLLAGSRATRVRAVMGQWDPTRPTEGGYTALLWFEDGAFASLTYSGYGRFDSDEWMGAVGEMGNPKDLDAVYGQARRRLALVSDAAAEAQLKAAGTYGGPAWKPPARGASAQAHHQHFGPVIVSCEHGDVRPLPDAVWVYGNEHQERISLPAPAVPRFEVVDELVDAVLHGRSPLHDGPWARATLEICLALLTSAQEDREVKLKHQVGLRK
jgi:phthalate 4,5-cis-dihydrodiol dehydrogenase